MSEKKKRVYTGQRVTFIPDHANGDINHPDCRDGIVQGFGLDKVTVKFLKKKNKKVKHENLVESKNWC